jgi:hypothetical protein
MVMVLTEDFYLVNSPPLNKRKTTKLHKRKHQIGSLYYVINQSPRRWSLLRRAFLRKQKHKQNTAGEMF